MNKASDSDNAGILSAKEVVKALAAAIASRIHLRVPEWDELTVTDLVDSAIDDIFAVGSNFGELSRGDVVGLFSALGKVVGIAQPAIAGPYCGTREILINEFCFLAFTLRGTPVFRHRKTGRDLYVAIERGEILIGMYDSSSGFSAFVKSEDALNWARGLNAPGNMPRRTTNLLWDLP